MPSWLFLPFSKALYRPGYGFLDLMIKAFTPASVISSTEIWTGMHHESTNQHRLFTNKKSGNTLIEPRDIRDPLSLDNLYIGTNINPLYANGDLNLISKATLASASLPWMVQPVRIYGEKYGDGGCLYASPLTVLKNEVYDLSVKGTRILRLFYFSPITLATQRSVNSSLLGVINDLIYSTRTLDIRAFIDVITLLGGEYSAPDIKRKMNIEELSTLLETLDTSGKHYAILLYPDVPYEVSKKQPENFLSLDMNI